jgi:predicted phage terminase large subunit-like protein
MGSYLFSNQYLNEVFPDGSQVFKKEWFRYYTEIPADCLTFIAIDPAISTNDGADYTAYSVVKVDYKKDWYILHTARSRITPTDQVNLVFQLTEQFKPTAIGIETVAYQKALMYMLHEEMRRRNKHIPLCGINNGGDTTKEGRILALSPRFEFGTIFLNQGMDTFEQELLRFPRGNHDDMIDSLAMIEKIVFYPEKKEDQRVPAINNAQKYESFYIKQLTTEHERERRRQEREFNELFND